MLITVLLLAVNLYYDRIFAEMQVIKLLELLQCFCLFYQLGMISGL